MPLLCCVISCKAKCCAQLRKEKGITFHRFPANSERVKKWIENINQKNLTIKRFTRICSRHFLPEMFEGVGSRTRLWPHAIPTVFDGANHPVKHLPETPIDDFKPNIITEAQHDLCGDHSQSIKHLPESPKDDFKSKITEVQHVFCGDHSKRLILVIKLKGSLKSLPDTPKDDFTPNNITEEQLAFCGDHSQQLTHLPEEPKDDCTPNNITEEQHEFCGDHSEQLTHLQNEPKDVFTPNIITEEQHAFCGDHSEQLTHLPETPKEDFRPNIITTFKAKCCALHLDHSYHIADSPKEMKTKLEGRIKNLRKKLKASETRLSQYRLKVRSMKVHMKNLKNKMFAVYQNF